MVNMCVFLIKLFICLLIIGILTWTTTTKGMYNTLNANNNVLRDAHVIIIELFKHITSG